MSGWLIAFVGLIYLCIGIEQSWRGNLAMGITFLGYAVSNIGLYKLAT
jgi:hypothetical protein